MDPARILSPDRGGMATNRYTATEPATRLTRKRLEKKAGIQSVIVWLRSEGWLDWQILAAMYTVSRNFRTAGAAAPENTREYAKMLRKWDGEERGWWPQVPVTGFTIESLTLARNMNSISTLDFWGLQLRQRMPDFPSILRFLAARYRNDEDGMEHDDPFPTVPSPAAA